MCFDRFMVKFIKHTPTEISIKDGEHVVTYNAHHIDMIHHSGGRVDLHADLFGARMATKLNDMPYPPFPQKEEKTVANTYHLNDDKNAAIGAVKVRVEAIETALLVRNQAIAKVTREQDALVAEAVEKLDARLTTAIQEDVAIEDLEEHIPHHNGVLAERVEAVISMTSLDKVAELV